LMPTDDIRNPVSSAGLSLFLVVGGGTGCAERRSVVF